MGAWNVRGLNDPLRQKEVLNLVRSQHLSLIGLVETKVRLENMLSTSKGVFHLIGVLFILWGLIL